MRSTDYPNRVMKLIDRVHQAPDIPSVVQTLHSTTEAMGAYASAYVLAIPEDEASRSLTLLLAGDARWLDPHRGGDPVGEHRWMVYASEHEAPIADSELSDLDTSSRPVPAGTSTGPPDHTPPRPQDAGFSSALIVPTPSASGLERFGVLCLGSNHAGDFEDDATHVVRVLARTLAMELSDRLLRETRDDLLLATGVRPLDLQMLAMERHGMGTKEIAHRVSLSESAVNSRFQRINARLRCPNRRSAARRAAEYGLI